MEYDSQKLIEFVDIELEKQKKKFEEKKENFEHNPGIFFNLFRKKREKVPEKERLIIR